MTLHRIRYAVDVEVMALDAEDLAKTSERIKDALRRRADVAGVTVKGALVLGREE